MSKKKRTTSSGYINTAKELKKLVPSLQKYQRRKSLNRWEKAAITRAANKVRRAGIASLVPLSKSQAKRLKDKSIIVGNGIRAVHARGVGADAKPVVRGGKLAVKTREGRKWFFERTSADPQSVIEAAERAFKRGAKGVDLWLFQGRYQIAMANLENFTNYAVGFFSNYDDLDETEEWFEGITYFA